MRKYVIMGVQGSGKGTHSALLAQDLDLVHIGVGDILRWNVQNHTKLGAQIRRTMSSGSLISDDVIEGVVKERLAEHDWNYGFIIDGFPRSERQANFFLESYDIDGVIHLYLPDSEVRRRVLARRLCASCGMDYNLIDNSPHAEGRCDACGGELIRREDDTEEALAVRLREYHSKTDPVLEIFRRKEYVVTVDTRPDKEIVQREIRKALSLPEYGLVAAEDLAAEADPVRVVIAPDSFKGTIDAAGAAAALAAGWRDVRPADELICLPLADGGEGTLAVLAAADPAASWHQAQVSGPGREQVTARWLELPGRTHVIELASAAGLPQLPRPDPLYAHTAGVGELLGLALAAGAQKLVIGLGGSASTDGGTGALAALGARFRDGAGRDLPRGGAPLAGLATADLSGLAPPPPGGVICLTDVRAPLLGPAGAAAVFGPQKGAGPGQVAELEAALARLAAVLGGQPDRPGAGAAGGTGYGLATAWGAQLLPGSAQIAEIAGLPGALAGTGLVITGEGQYDVTSGTGKVVGAVSAAAAKAGVPAAVVAGVLAGPLQPGLREAVELARLAGGTAAAMAEPARWLRTAGRSLAGQQDLSELTRDSGRPGPTGGP